MDLIAVIRVSTEEQMGVNGEGMDRQRQAVARIVSQNQARLVNTIEISDVSGSDLADTPEWKNVIVPAMASGCSIAADSIDRIVRADSFDFRTFFTARQFGARIVTPGRIYDTTDHRDVMALTLFGGLGGYEKAEIKRRIWAGKEAKRKRGEWPHSAHLLPFGITYDRATKTWGYSDKATQIKQAYLDIAQGRTLRSIASTIGLTPPGLILVIRNPIYKGVLTFSQRSGLPQQSKNGRQPTKKKVDRAPEDVIRVGVFSPSEQLVTDQLWEDANRHIDTVRAKRRRARETGRNDLWASVYLLSAHAPINTEMFGEYQSRHIFYGRHCKSGAPPRYQCRCTRAMSQDPGKPKENCGNAWFLALEVNKALDVLLKMICTDSSYRDSVLTQVQQNPKDPAKEKATLQTRLNDLSKKERRLVDLHVDGRISREIYDQRFDALKSEKASIEKAMSAIVETPDISVIQSHLESMTWSADWSPDRKRRWLAQYVDFISIGRKGFHAVSLRLPGNQFCLIEGDFNWISLLGYDITDTNSRMKALGKYLAADVAGRLRIRTDQLSYFVRTGKLPKPAGRWGQKMIWTAQEILISEKIYRDTLKNNPAK